MEGDSERMKKLGEPWEEEKAQRHGDIRVRGRKKAYLWENFGIKSDPKPCASSVDVLKPEFINRERWKAGDTFTDSTIT